ncbi:TPA: cell division topological specificity factor MinE [Candidatus Galligastranaerophilus intestinigallinarum]|nr:cell division topological specificity factor MinE [Candidatus Galligastranaerophilus intestinigallinarum]
MRDLFQELYNKVLSLFNSSKEEINPTKSLAVNRLKTVLMQDRVGFSERAIQMLKEELIATVTKYMEIDTENFELQIDAMDNSKTVLNLSIPVLRPKTDDEIDANIKEQQLKTQKKAQEIVKELEGLIKERTQALIDGKIDPSLLEEATKKASLEEETEEVNSKEENVEANLSEQKNEEEAENSNKEESKESENAVS